MLGSAAYFPFLLLGTGVFLTLYLGFPQLRFFRHAIQVARGKFDKPGTRGDASHFQALTTAISGTVGTGNIGGVAFALFLGGPAALFWMWMTALFGMATKFAEVSLSHKYRQTDEQGHIVGGPMFVLERRLNMKWLAIFFAVATVISSFGTGSLPQSNNIASGMAASFGAPEWLTGLVLAALLGLVVIGGITRIVKVAEKVVPFMAIIYLIGALAVILPNLPQVGASLVAVFRDAFTGSAAAGGFLGASFAYAFNRGVNRGLFSNEAGQGSAPIAHATARTDQPVSEGMVSILEPFIDTIILCTLTGLVILSSGVWTEKLENNFQRFDMQYLAGNYSDKVLEDRKQLFSHLNTGGGIKPFTGDLHIEDGKAATAGFTLMHNRSVAEDVRYYLDGALYNGKLAVVEGNLQGNGELQVRGKSLIHSVELTSVAFTRGLFGDFGKYIVSIGLALFAFTTAVAWSYYGDRAMTYLFGVKSVLPYRAVYVLGFFIAAIADTSLIWLASAVAITIMTLPNLFSLLMLHRELRGMMSDYWLAIHPDRSQGGNGAEPQEKN